MNELQENIADTPEPTLAERSIESVREQGGMFVEAVCVNCMPTLVTDATLPGNPIVVASQAFIELSGYTVDELAGQEFHFMSGPETDPDAIRRYQGAIAAGRDETLEILQYPKDGRPFRVMLFASPLGDGQGSSTNHFFSYLDITRRYNAEASLPAVTLELEERVVARTRELEATNGRLTKLVSEREMLLVEVNHRAKNSLAIAASLLAIQGRRQPDPGVRVLFEEAQDRLTVASQIWKRGKEGTEAR
jgi:PAS domain S-box-containing protein